MEAGNMSLCDFKDKKFSSLRDVANASLCTFDSPSKNHLNVSIKNLFASFGLTPPSNICRSGSRDALWFSKKFEKKMAALEDDVSSSPLTRFQRAVPLRQSKLIAGPFRATQIWNDVIEQLKEKVEIKKRRYKLKNYESCFTGTNAADVVLHYLVNNQDSFCNPTREKAVKLCQTLMEKKVFLPVGCKESDTMKHLFEDSSNKLYHFCGIHNINNKENDGYSDSDDEIDCRDDICETTIDERDDSLYTPQKLIRVNPDIETSLLDEDIVCNPSSAEKPGYDLTDSNLVSRKRKNLDSSLRNHKRQKLCLTPSTSSSSTDTYNDEYISDEKISEVEREIALCQLLTLVDISFLDGVLTEEKQDKQKRKVVKPHRSGIVSNIVAKQWSMKCSARSASHTDPFMRSALDCIAHIPRGVSKFDTDFSKGNDPVTKLQAYNMICEHYAMRPDSIFPERFLDLNLSIIKLILSERYDSALHAMQLNMILLPGRQREELRRLLEFLSVAVSDTSLNLDPQGDNEQTVLNNFSDCILKHKGLPKDLSIAVVQFLIKYASRVFTLPSGFKERVDSRIEELKEGVVPVVTETVFCEQLPVSEYQRQTEDFTQQSLVNMMNLIIDNTKMALKEKKQKLRQFKKIHPEIYSKHFTDMV
ncbi:DEP domain-containing protein 7 [Mactra antiquata]